MSFMQPNTVERMTSTRSSRSNIQPSVLERKYIFEYDLGMWTFGRVQVVKDRQSNELKVCKMVDKASVRDPQSATARLNRLKEFSNEHIAKVTDVLQDQNYFYVIQDQCMGGDLAEWSHRVHETSHWLQEHTVAEYIRQVLIALHHGHGSNIYHRDLRPSSLLLTSKMPDAKVKVADFGLADILDPGYHVRRGERCPYAAPEVLDPDEDGLVQRAPLGAAADLWSVGAIAQYLLTGNPPPREDAPAGAWAALARVGSRMQLDAVDDLDPQMHERSPMSRDFVRRLLRHQANERPTAAAALQLPWMEACFTLNPSEWVGSPEVVGDVRSRVICYTLALLMLPAKMEYPELFQLRTGFNSMDTDNDTFLSTPVAHKLLRDRGATSVAAAMALDVVDVKGAGVVDMATAAAASVIAFGGFCHGEGKQIPSRPSDVMPRLLKGFFTLFGDPQRMVSAVTTFLDRHNPNVAREAEMHAGLSYEDMLENLDGLQCFDEEALIAAILDNRGRGTPLAAPDCPSDSEEDAPAWVESLGLGRFNQLLGSMLATCTSQQSRSGCATPICNVNMLGARDSAEVDGHAAHRRAALGA